MIPVKDLFVDDNAYLILARCRKAARKTWTPEQWETFDSKAKSGDIDTLLQTVMEYFREDIL